MKNMLKSLLMIFLFSFLSVGLVQAAFIGISWVTSANDFYWPDATWTAASTDSEASAVNTLDPWESAADTDGKSYHYIIGAASCGGTASRFSLTPIQAAGYNHVTIQTLMSNIGVADTTAVFYAQGIDFDLIPYGSVYPASYMTGGAISDGTMQSAYPALTSPFQNLPHGNIINSPTDEPYIPLAISDARMRQYEINGGVARLTCYVSAHTSTSVAAYATGHVFIRLSK